jgi:choline kinase
MRIKSNCEAISTGITRINPEIISTDKMTILKVIILKLTRVMNSFEVSVMNKTIKYVYIPCNRFMKAVPLQAW